ncbi:MAG: type IX secretion system plug protein domain-containing protein, partial [Ginsengibacter sp.]
MTDVKNACYKCYIILLLIPIGIRAKAVSGDSVYVPNIHSVRLHTYGDQTGLPLLSLGSNDLVELHFDDLNGGVKYYYYTYQLCNADWKPVNVSQFDYLKGFTQMRFTNYRFSSIAYTRYTHYQAMLPEKSAQPIRSGNYIIKAFLDGDTSKVVFTKRLLVLNNKATISARVTQPFLPEYFRTHQKLQFNINITGLNTFSATQQIKVAVLQNNRWDNAYINIPPTFIRGTSLEYNTENIV